MTHEHFRAFAVLVVVVMTSAAAIFDWIHIRRFTNADAPETSPAGDTDQGGLRADERVSTGHPGDAPTATPEPEEALMRHYAAQRLFNEDTQ